MTREIPLTQGQVAIVDDDDYEELIKHKWCAMKNYKTFYATRSVNGRMSFMHREIMKPLPSDRIDHKDGVGTHNTRDNMRIASSLENAQNRGIRSDSTSGYKGVTWKKSISKWESQIQINGKKTYIGVFGDIIEAARAYDSVAKKHFGEFARTNFND